MFAILRALQSDIVYCLRLTYDTMTHSERQRYGKLMTLLKRESNYGAYRTVVERHKTKGCIPWHGAHFNAGLCNMLTDSTPQRYISMISILSLKKKPSRRGMNHHWSTLRSGLTWRRKPWMHLSTAICLWHTTQIASKWPWPIYSGSSDQLLWMMPSVRR